MKSINPEKQEQILKFLKKRESTGVPPTVREICAATGIKSTSTVQLYLTRMKENGLIEKTFGQKRSVRLPSSYKVTQVPILGKITAGIPILAVEDPIGTLPYPANYGQDDLFALSVKGDSMIHAGILDQDYIIAEKNNAPENGDIVVALIDDEATVKRFFFEKDGKIRLQPENPCYKPIIGENIMILGKVVSVIRYYHR